MFNEFAAYQVYQSPEHLHPCKDEHHGKKRLQGTTEYIRIGVQLCRFLGAPRQDTVHQIPSKLRYYKIKFNSEN